MKRTLNIIIILLMFSSLKAQIKVEYKAFLDTNIIDFASQTDLHIQVKTNKPLNVIFPHFKDTIATDVEIVKEFPIDTTGSMPFVFDKKYTITSFEDSLKIIPPMRIIINNDTLFTDTIRFYVKKLYLDSTEIAQIDTNQIIRIFGIKKPYDAPFTFKEFWLRFGKKILIILLIAGIIALLIWLYINYKNNKAIFKFKPQEPAHIIALRRLQELKDKKLYQKGKVKEYYSELTDILREYIERRFDFPALERTSTEILTNFSVAKLLDKETFNDLKKLLNVADMAKFAKYKPSQDINENNFNLTKKFIEETKIEPVEENTENENQQENLKNQN